MWQFYYTHIYIYNYNYTNNTNYTYNCRHGYIPPNFIRHYCFYRNTYIYIYIVDFIHSLIISVGSPIICSLLISRGLNICTSCIRLQRVQSMLLTHG